MKKHVLNIERIYAGQTSNAIVLRKVEDEFPRLVETLSKMPSDLTAWMNKIEREHGNVLRLNPDGVDIDGHVDVLNDMIVEFNLGLQQIFKDSGHDELYMMDDTRWMRPDTTDQSNSNRSYKSDKKYLHSINGLAKTDEDSLVNFDQLNVLFPASKILVKSLYQNNLRIHSQNEIDDVLERSLNITLQGRCSFQKCLQFVASAGGNLYTLSPSIGLNGGIIHNNGTTLVSGMGTPYVFPSSTTLFHPGVVEDQGMTGKDDVYDWLHHHDHYVVVTQDQTYGGSTSILKCLGADSYELELATYSPTDIVVDRNYNEVHRLDSSSMRRVKSFGDIDEPLNNGWSGYSDGKWMFSTKTDDGIGVGFMFNLYDTFLTGVERKIRVVVPESSDHNNMKLVFSLEFPHADELGDSIQAFISINGSTERSLEEFCRPVEYPINDVSLNDGYVDISVMILYDVDFTRRNSELDYMNMLKRSGVVIRNIRLIDGVSEDLPNLTYGSYLNEHGISEEEHENRYRRFWDVSRYIKDTSYQTVAEQSLRNIISSGVECPNNYSTGDMYGDVFATKSVYDCEYDMNISTESDIVFNLIGRDYFGLGSCSDQLSLLYNPISLRMRISDQDGNALMQTTRQPPLEHQKLKYQNVEVVKNINRLESSIKHKSNVFSVLVENSNLAKDSNAGDDDVLEKYKDAIRDSITQFVRNACKDIVPVHTQLFDVQFT